MFTFEPPPPPPSLPTMSGLGGGASRVVLGGGAKRTRPSSRPSLGGAALGPSSAISKSGGPVRSNRRMSLVARQSEAGDALRAQRAQEATLALRRNTMDPRT